MNEKTKGIGPVPPAIGEEMVADSGAPPVRVARWQTVYLVCKDCSDRSRGPKHLKPKRLAEEVRSETKRASVRARVVMTGCLGLCPKGAAAMAIAGASGVRLVAVRSKGVVPAALAALAGPPSAAATSAPVQDSAMA